jgi:DNA-binding transcriptional MerR regulator
VATPREDLRQRVRLEQQLIARLRTANLRFSDAQTERIWAIASAHQAGLSIRKIAGATGLSSSRIHQLLNAPEAQEIPVWLSQLRPSNAEAGGTETAEGPEPETTIRSRLARELEVLRRCIDWLQRLERGETVVVNLRPDTEVDTEFVSFDRLRVLRVQERIAADLDSLSLVPNDPHADKESNHHDPRARHRHELAEPPQEPKKLSHQEQRRALRAALGLPPL